MSNSGHFPPQNSPDWLPAGWTVEIRSNNGKNVKSYVDQLTGYRFYSKPKVLEYLRTQNSWRSQMELAGSHYDINLPQNLNETPGLLPHRSVTETPYWENGSQSGNIHEHVASESLHSGEMKAEKSPDWLPSGWTEEVKIRDGQIVKTYVDPLWGHRFYTKPQVLHYLGVVANDSSTSQKETASNNSGSNLIEKISGTSEPLPNVLTMTTPWENSSQSKIGASEMSHSGKIMYEKTPDWLPTGWTVEFKIINGRSTKSYVDSLTQRKFYSKPKVLEYLGTAKLDGGTSERKKIGYDFDINLPVDINDPLETLPHGVITELETGENGSQSGKSFKLPLKTIDRSKPLPDGWITEVKTGKDGSICYKSPKLYIDPVTGRKFNSKQKVFEYLGTVKSDSATSQQKKTVLDYVSKPDLDVAEGVTSSPQLVEFQNGNSLNNSIHLSTTKETSSRKRPIRKPNAAITEDVTPPPQLVESQDVKTLNNTIHLSTSKETTSRKRPGRKPNAAITEDVTPPPQLVVSQDVKTLNNTIHLSTSKETTSKKRPGRKLYVDKTEGATPLPQLVESLNVKTLSDVIHLSTPKEKSSRESPGKKPKVDRTPPQQLVESQNVNSLNHNGYTSTLNETSSSKKAGRKLPEGLPPGWITEIRIKKTGNKTKKLSYYIDPVSGYVFSSKTDTWRYLEAGDISKCVIKPKKREEMGFTTKRSSPNADKVGSKSLLQLLEEPKHVNTRKLTRFSPEVNKLSSIEECVSEMVIERVVADGLPSGWIKEVKIQKFYTDPRSGYVFMSQKDALCYLETGDIGTCAVKPRSRDELGLIEGSTMNKTGGGPPLLHLEQSQNENTPRLTRLSSQQKEMSTSKQSGGEIVERVAPKGPSPGLIKENSIQKKAIGTRRDTPKMDKTRGKPALQQLEQSQGVNTPDPASFSSPEKEVISFKHNGIETVLERVAPTGLPPGWIKEIRFQKKADGIRRDPFYTDPVSGYVFSSQKDVFRYVKTGDISICAIRPKKREEFGFNQGSYTMFPAVVQDPERDTTKELLYTGKKVGSKRGLETVDLDVSQIRRGTRSSITTPAVMQKLEGDTTRKQLSTGKFGSLRSLETLDSDASQKRRPTRSAATPAAMQKSGSDTAEKQHATGKKVGSKRSLETMESDVSQKRRQTRASAASPAVMQKLGSDTTAEQISKGKKAGSKRSLETMDSDVSQKRRQTRSSASAVATATPIVALPKETPKLENVIQKPTKAKKGSGSNRKPLPKTTASAVATAAPIVKLPKEAPKLENVIQKPTKAKKGSGSNRKPLPKTKASKIRSPPSSENLKVKNVSFPSSAENSEVKNVRSPPSSKNSKVKNAKKSAIKKSSNKKNHYQDSKPKKKETKKEMRTPPSRVSKRISGLNAETLPKSGSSDQALASEVEKSGNKKDIPCLNSPKSVTACEQPLTAEVEKPGKEECIPCPEVPNNVASSEQIPTSEVENSGENRNIPCPNVSDSVANNANQQLETVADMGDREVEKSGQNEDNTCPNASLYVFDDASRELEAVSEMGKMNNALGSAEALSIAEVSNKSYGAAKDQTQDQTVSQEPSEVANKSMLAMDDQSKDQTRSQEKPSELSDKSNEVMDEDQAEDHNILQEQRSEVLNKNENVIRNQTEDQTISKEQPTEVLNKNEAVENQTEDQTISQEQLTEVSNKSEEAMEDQTEDQTISQEQPTKFSNKSRAMEDKAEDQTVSQEQPTEVSNKSKEAMEDQAEDRTISQEQPTEVSNKCEAMEDQTVSQEQPTEVSNRSKEVMEDQSEDQTVLQDRTISQEQPTEVSNKCEAMEDQTVSQEQPTEVSNKSKEVMEDQSEDQTVSQDQPMYQFGEETWSDPCLDFAFKTLTGTLAFEDNNVPVPNIFQAQGDTSQVKTSDNCFTPLDFGAPSVPQADNSHALNGSEAFRQVDNSDVQNGSEALGNTEPITQLPTNAIFLPDINSSLPSGSETAPQQNDREENKNGEKNELTLDNYARFIF